VTVAPHPGAAPATVPAASEKYVRELDGIRAVAVSIVVLAHYSIVPHVPGGFGVTLFFFLSGYLITTLLCSEYNTNRTIDIPRFYLRRWLRLTPPLIISIVIGVTFYHETRVAVGGHPVPAGITMAALLYYTNYYDIYWSIADEKIIPFGICWSLAVEEHFYLFWPWLLRRHVSRPQRLSIIVMALCVAVLVWRIAARHVLLVSDDYTSMATDCRIDSILYGALLRLLLETPWAPAVMRLLRAPASRIVAILALVASLLIRDENFRDTFRFTIQGIALMPIFLAVLCDDPNSWPRRVLSSPPMVLIGRLSYSIYLFHLLARTPGEVYFGSPMRTGSMVSGLIITLVAAYTVYVLVERPIARLRHRFRANGHAARPAAAFSSLAVASLPPLGHEPGYSRPESAG
jgi:peptidoglycan/LPS O-acetylase OafA/YrhL